MCSQLEPGGSFGFLTEGLARVGARGVLCDLTDLRRNSNGTYDALVRARAYFTLLEVREATHVTTLGANKGFEA